MNVLIVMFTILLVVDCLFLGLLILVQLPKKEAGIGMAFGSGATDALFGAGSGTALSNLTQYTATAFFILVFVLSLLNTHARSAGTGEFRHQFETQRAPATPVAPGTTAIAPAPATSNGATAIPLTISTNSITTAPAVPSASNALAAPVK